MPSVNRRRLVLAGLLALPGAARALEACIATPRDALGPFYVPGAPAQADLCAATKGAKLVVEGTVYGLPDCGALAGATVEVWQADGKGDYTMVDRARRDDPNCLLRATLTTDAKGGYRYTTLLPGEYPGRPRHIHYRVSHPRFATLVTQLYFRPERGLDRALVREPKAAAGGGYAVRFDIVLDRTGAGR